MSGISEINNEESIINDNNDKENTGNFNLYKTTADGEVLGMRVTVRPITEDERHELRRKAVEVFNLRDTMSAIMTQGNISDPDLFMNNMLMFNRYLSALYGACAVQDCFDADFDKVTELILSCDENCIMELKEYVMEISNLYI